MAETNVLAARYAGYSTTGFLMCSCGYAANNPVRFHDHLTGNPDHEPRYQP